jgi:hypothetical protein
MALPEIKERLATLGFDSIARSPEEFADTEVGQGDPCGQHKGGVTVSLIFRNVRSANAGDPRDWNTVEIVDQWR